MEPLTIERSIWINAPREHVWHAITTVEHLRQWWGDDHWAWDSLEVGARIEFGDPNNPMIAHTASIDPPRQWIIRWPPQQEYNTITMYLTYLLEERDGGTQVTVTESGYEGFSDDVREQRYQGSIKGYDIVLDRLKQQLEHPV